ncbi:MAG: rRNA maturation RNase YbeY [Dysgonamonadaceae bacterium]|jgi:rRNA maturation RNase YbeY|nr:rRNA maturation RNase YbeY [Dysgonamonadaceae bacterium]
MAISYFSQDVPFPKIKRRETTRWIQRVAESHSRKIGSITYIFCSDAEILRLNEQYLNHDYYTDIITFDDSEDLRISGDLFISLDTVRTNVEKYQTDYAEELNRVMIHGVLHLCGFKDKTPQDEQRMREREEQALKML